MEQWNNRVFLLTLSTLPAACTTDVANPFFDDDTGQGSTSSDPTTGVSMGESSGSDDGDDSGSTSMDVTATGTDTGQGSTSDATTDGSTGEPGSTGGSTDDDGSSSTTAAPTLCEAWAEAFNACSGYGLAYLEMLCEYYLLGDPVCSAEQLEMLECEAYGGGFCGAGCQAEYEALDACEVQAEAKALGCYDLPTLEPSGMLEAACATTVNKAHACDQAGTYISGFSQYLDYPDAFEAMQSFCMSGAYWTFGVDPFTACGGAYEDLLACIQPLSCEAFDEIMFFPPLDGTCGAELTAVECACDLGIG